MIDGRHVGSSEWKVEPQSGAGLEAVEGKLISENVKSLESCLVVKMPFGTPSSYIRVPGFILDLFSADHTLGGS